MARKNRRTHTPKKATLIHLHTKLIFGAAFLLSTAGLSVYHFVQAAPQPAPIAVTIDPNIGLEQRVIEFFTDNDAPEMIPIIKCESHFRHFNPDGTVLTNKAGSSATGIAQIIASKHPDPKIVYRYNTRTQTDLTVADLDITTVEGNLGYALMLYRINGTRDWECAKKFRFRS